MEYEMAATGTLSSKYQIFTLNPSEKNSIDKRGNNLSLSLKAKGC